eukprot:2415656-Prymnesium_polylepis.1
MCIRDRVRAQNELRRTLPPRCPICRYCELTDWYEGSNVAHGWFSEPDAPALLGFDADIIGYCHNNCDGESVNILAIFGGLEYNSCRNFEWQMCAIRGMLSSQSSKEIVFARCAPVDRAALSHTGLQRPVPPLVCRRAPKTVAMDGWPPFGQCSGFTNSGCNTWDGFANDDIFYLEVCLFSQVCANSEQLFQIDVGERFVCDFSADGFEQLQAWLLDGPDMRVRDEQASRGKWCALHGVGALRETGQGIGQSERGAQRADVVCGRREQHLHAAGAVCSQTPDEWFSLPRARHRKFGYPSGHGAHPE